MGYKLDMTETGENVRITAFRAEAGVYTEYRITGPNVKIVFTGTLEEAYAALAEVNERYGDYGNWHTLETRVVSIGAWV